MRAEFRWLAEEQIARYVRSYGTLCRVFLRGMRCAPDMGEDFGAGLTEREVKYLREHEWARDAETLLWRRSKLGLHLSADQQARLAAYLEELNTAEREVCPS